jgi:glycosyltransferase involved in cell wall biosynthesis
MRLSLRSESDGPKTGGSQNQPPVAILLSTFNGERFLGEQLLSYTAQTHGNWTLYCRDDGSTDSSRAMIEAFRQGPGWARVVQLPNDEKLRATGSFLALLDTALREDAEFFAFSDQDDVWLPEKLAHAVAALNEVEVDRPALYFCPRTPVDRGLRPLGQTPSLRRPLGFPAALTQNVIPGCCMTLNRAAAEIINTTRVPEQTWHDWWCYLLVSAREGLVIKGDTPDILYRQHDSNLVGEPRKFWHRSAAAVRRGRDPFLDLFWRHVAALQSYPDHLPARTREMLATIIEASRGGIMARAKVLFIPGLVRQTWWETLLFRVWFLLG